MLRLKPRQREILIEKWPDLANLAMGGLVFGQFLSERPLSIWLMGLGWMIWIFLVGCAVAIREGKEPWKAP